MAAVATLLGRLVRSPRAWLVAVCAAYLVVQVVWMRAVPLGWDETVYSSQVDPRRPALEFSAPRARGISLVVAPLHLVTGSPEALRIYLALVTSAGLYAAYAVWLRLRPDGSVPLAALLYILPWTALMYGSEAMPNVYVALAAVAATGWFAVGAQAVRPRPALVAVAAAVGFITLVRPGDGAPVVGALAVAALVVPAWRARRRALLLALAAGAVAGALPWLVEAQLRYSDVLSRTRRALAAQSTTERFVPDYQLRALAGPRLCRPCSHDLPVPWSGLLWWTAGGLLVVAGVWLAYREHRRLAAWLPAWVGAATGVPYLVLVGYAAPRFMLPMYALLALPSAQALRALTLRPPARARLVIVPVVVAALVAHGAAQLRILGNVVQQQVDEHARYVAVAGDLRRLGVTPPCTLIGVNATPIAYVAGCDAVRVARYPGDEQFSVGDLRQVLRHQVVALLAAPREVPASWAEGWGRVPRSRTPHLRGGVVYVAPHPLTSGRPAPAGRG